MPSHKAFIKSVDVAEKLWLKGRMSDLSTIQARRAELAAHRQAIEAEEQELAIAERVLVRLARNAISRSAITASGSAVLDDLTLEANATVSSNSLPKTFSTKDLIRSLLSSSAVVWLTSQEVRDGVVLAKGRDVPKSTIGPTLTAMKEAGIIVRDGNKVALKERAQTNGAY